MQVAVVSKDLLLREGLDSLLLRHGVLGVAGSCATVAQALDLVGHSGGILILTDDQPTKEFDLLRKVKDSLGLRVVLVANHPAAAGKAVADRVVLRSQGSDAMIRAILDLMPPAAQGVAEAIQVRYGGKKLSQRELQVAQLIARGLGNRRIAETLNIKEQSVKNLVSSILTKLGCDNRTQVVLALFGQNVEE